MGKFFKNFFKIVGVVLVLALIFCLFFIFDLFKDEQLPITREQEDPSILNALVVGYDEGIESAARPDTILLVSVDLKEKAVGILSLPRDTRVEVPNKGMHKLNSSYVLGGIEFFQQIVEDLTGIPIHCYVQLDFKSFESLIDTLGGVEIDVKQQMTYRDEAGGVYINIKPGLQVLDGKNALDFVRWREPVKADIGRIARQQQFLKAVLDKALNVKMLPKLPAMITDAKNSIDTNLSLKDIARLTKMAGDFPRDRIEMATLPGEPEYINGVSYWLPAEERMNRILLSLIETKDYTENSRYSITLLNGSGEKGLASEKGEILEDWGFKIASLGNADNFDYQFTTIYYGEEGLEGAVRISSIIGGVPRNLEEIEGKQLRVVLGKDQCSK